MFKVLNWNLHSFRLLEIIQGLDSISWVRCASGNVYLCTFVFDKILTAVFWLFVYLQKELPGKHFLPTTAALWLNCWAESTAVSSFSP